LLLVGSEHDEQVENIVHYLLSLELNIRPVEGRLGSVGDPLSSVAKGNKHFLFILDVQLLDSSIDVFLFEFSFDCLVETSKHHEHDFRDIRSILLPGSIIEVHFILRELNLYKMAPLVLFVINEKGHKDQVELLEVLDHLVAFCSHARIVTLELPSEINIAEADFLRFSSWSHLIRQMLTHDLVVFLEHRMHFLQDLEKDCDDIVVEENTFMEFKKLVRCH